MDITGNNETLRTPTRRVALLMAGLAVVSACSSTAEGTEAFPDSTTTTRPNIELDAKTNSEQVVNETGMFYPETAVPIESAGNALSEKEKTTGKMDWLRRLGSIYPEDYPGNITQILRGEIGIVNTENPLAILEYTQLRRLYATCTGNSEEIYKIYLADKGAENGEMAGDLKVIHDRQVRSGNEYYGDSFDCRGWGWNFDSRTAQNIIWSEDKKTVTIDIDQWSNNSRDMIPVRIEHRFVDGDWQISSKIILEP